MARRARDRDGRDLTTPRSADVSDDLIAAGVLHLVPSEGFARDPSRYDARSRQRIEKLRVAIDLVAPGTRSSAWTAAMI